MKDTSLERGSFIRTRTDPATLAYFPENKPLITDLFKKYRLEWVLDSKGQPFTELKDWIAIGLKGQLYEYGPGTLGISIEGQNFVPAFIRKTKSFTTLHQRGEDEASLTAPWTPENLQTLASLLKLRKRKHLSPDQIQHLTSVLNTARPPMDVSAET